MSSVEDQIANKVLQDLYCEITDQLNIELVIPRLYSKRRITKSELDQLQNIVGNLTDQQKKYILYSTALADKGKHGLDAFLEVLDDTSIQYDPHAFLAGKLRAKFQEYEWLIPVQDECHGTKRTLRSCKSSLFSLPDGATHQGTYRALQSSPSLPMVNSNTRSNLPVHVSLGSTPDHDDVSGSNVTNLSPVSAPVNDDVVTVDSPQEQLVCIMIDLLYIIILNSVLVIVHGEGSATSKN